MSIKRHIQDFAHTYFREFRLVLHDPGVLLFFIFLPFAYPIIYSLIYNPELVREVKMVVVDHDRTPMSREVVRKLDASQYVNIIGYASDLNEGKHAMNSHECFSILEIPEGFQKKIGRNEQAQAVMYCDMSLLLRYRAFLVASTDIMLEMGSELLTEKIDLVAPLAATIADGDPMPMHNVSMGDTTSGFDSFIMPGVLVLILHQCIILAVGMVGGARHEGKRFTKYETVGCSSNVFLSMLSRTCCYLTFLIVPIIFMFHYVPVIFRFPMCGNEFEIYAFLIPMILACFGLGYTLQGCCRQRESVFVIWVVTSVAFLFLSGLTWPRYAMDGFWKAVADIIPATWGVQGFIRMNSNGASLAQVHTAYTNLWILAAGWWLVGWLVQKFVMKRVEKRTLADEIAFETENNS